MFKQRSYQSEFLDEQHIQKEQLYNTLKELDFINKYLGGNRVSLTGLKRALGDKLKQYHVVDVGCGGGGALKVIKAWSQKESYRVCLTGVDLKQDCVDYAQSNCKDYPDICFRCDDFRNALLGPEVVDVVHSSLFCHHFAEDELVKFITQCTEHGAVVVINDLERNPLAYFSIKFLTRLLSQSPLIKNDAPLSVLRGFKKKEWASILQKSGIRKYIIENHWAFRHLVIAYPNEE